MKDMMLIVDDIEMNREILKAIFNQKYEILEAENGEEALSIVNGCQGSIDIVLLDLMMDGLSGFDVLERRREMEYFRRIPVVVITSSGHMQDQIRAFDLGANEFIAKPFVPEIVLSRVNNVMSSTRRMQLLELEAQKMNVKSEMDEMTGLCNKITSEYHMDKILKMGEGRLEVMIAADIDNLGRVNEEEGQQAGDHAVKVIASLISGLFRKSDIVGRIGDDEFCILMAGVPDIEIAHAKVNELIQLMKYKPGMALPEYVTLSVGMAANEKKSTSYAEQLEKCEQALLEAKQGGKAQYREYGAVLKNENLDERPIAVLLSRSRTVCSTVHALVPSCVRILEIPELEALSRMDQTEKNRVCMMYVDISAYTESMEEYWEQIAALDWIDMRDVFAICEEGNIPQYLAALNCGVADMFTYPIDHDAFKRRTFRKLEQKGQANE